MTLAGFVTLFVVFDVDATALKMPLKSAEPVEARWLRVPGSIVCINTFYLYVIDFYVAEFRLLAAGMADSFC